jgi:transcriptional repressor BetI
VATGGVDAVRPRKERMENAARRRRQLVEATLRSVVRNGLTGTTLATVAQEAGLSQGVAVFYYRTKQALLAEALRHHYGIYQDNWKQALAAVGADPAARIWALVRADFEPAVCNPDALAVWHAFWGEASARPLYARIAEAVDEERASVMRAACSALQATTGSPIADAEELASGIESLTDGLWLRMYLAPETLDAAAALRIVAAYLTALFPGRAAAFAPNPARG